MIWKTGLDIFIVECIKFDPLEFQSWIMCSVYMALQN